MKEETGMDELRESLREEMKTRSLTLADVGRGVGLSATAVSQWLSEKYPGDNARVAEAVRCFLTREKAKREAPRPEIGFVQTLAATRYFEVCAVCHRDGEIGVFTAPPGTGKTCSGKEYARLHPDVILIEADLGFTAGVLFTDLCKRLGLPTQGVVHDLFENVVDKLMNSGRLIIVDEAEHLPYRALELLRRVHDKAGVGIVLVGLPRLIENLRGKRGEYAQLYSRVGISGSSSGLSPEDCARLVAEAIPNANGIAKTFHEVSRGNARTMVKLLRRSVSISALNGSEITPELVRGVAQMLII